jgi:diketogulonate reductase-like aldo/keto reductase
MINEAYTLHTGAKMPAVGLGTWKSPPEAVGKAVKYALGEAGYSHIDCAAIYRNEKEIGSAFKHIFGSGIRKREEVFVTSKLWNGDHPRERVRKACGTTLTDLNLDYLDLYLMHWGIAIPQHDGPPTNPHGRWTEQHDAHGILITEKVPIRETWEAMEELVRAGLVRAIGVANFTAPMLNDLFSYASIRPAVNQIELHPYLQQLRLVEFCQHQGMVVTGYAPLGSPGNYREKGFPIIIEDKAITDIAAAHGKTPAKVLIRWGLQRGTVVIPKSVTPARIRENIGVFDFDLSEEDMQAIATLDRKLRFVDPYAWWGIPYFN